MECRKGQHYIATSIYGKRNIYGYDKQIYGIVLALFHIFGANQTHSSNYKYI